MTDVPRFRWNEDDLRLEPASDGAWMVYAFHDAYVADVSSRLQQLEQENARPLRALKATEISQPQPAASADGGEHEDGAGTTFPDTRQFATVARDLRDLIKSEAGRIAYVNDEIDALTTRYNEARAAVVQLEAEKAPLERENVRLRMGCIACSANETYSVAAFCSECYHAIVQGEADADAELSEARAALAETRDALQQLVKEWKTEALEPDEWLPYRQGVMKCARHLEAFLSRVDTPGASDALVPQPPSEPTSTPSPVKEQERSVCVTTYRCIYCGAEGLSIEKVLHYANCSQP